MTNQTRPKGLAPMGALEPRRLYRLASRNLSVGVWDPAAKGFTGIREKFGTKYLAVEYHWDASPTCGTVRGAEPLNMWIPSWCELDAYRAETICHTCFRAVTWSGPPAPAPWVHVEKDAPTGHAIHPMRMENALLFRLLTLAEARLEETSHE